MSGARGGWYRWDRSQMQYPLAQLTADEQKGAVYVGPCRCGLGLHAHHRLSDGRIVHASSMGSVRPARPEDTTSELETLRNENEELGRRVKELEQKLKKQ